MLTNNQNEHYQTLKEYYNLFNLKNSQPSKLIFYQILKKQFTNLQIPEEMTKLTLGCNNPIIFLIEDIIKQNLKLNMPFKILDIGGGAGFDTFLLKQILPNAQIINVDLSYNLLKTGHDEFLKNKININSPDSKIHFICANVENIPLNFNFKFDYIISNAVLNLIIDKNKVLNYINNLLTDNGSFILADIAYSNINQLTKNIISQFNIKDGIYYSPTIIDDKTYEKLIFNNFNYCKLAIKNEVTLNINENNLMFYIFVRIIKKNPPFNVEVLNCNCQNKNTINLYLEVDFESSPVFSKLILNKELNSIKCSKCGHVYNDFIPFYFSWKTNNINAHVFPSSFKNKKDEIISYVNKLNNSNELIFFGYNDFYDFIIPKINLK